MKQSTTGLVIKKSNIRIWIHRRNLENLQRVVWEGHGSKLLIEHSNNPKIKKFLEAVPRLMRLIQEIHTDVINDDINALKQHTESPIPDIVFSGKDANGLTSLHKAAGLGRQEIAEYIVQRYPQSVHLVDNEGRTPLHFAALVKDEDRMYDYLIVSGTDESALDNKQRTAAYYKTKNADIDSKLLQVVPDAPRMAHDSFPPNWDWSLITACTPTEENKKGDNVFGQASEKENGDTEILKTEDNEKNDDDKQDDSLAEESNHVEEISNGNQKSSSAKSTRSTSSKHGNDANNDNEEPADAPEPEPEVEPEQDPEPEEKPEAEAAKNDDDKEEAEEQNSATRPSTSVKESSRPPSTRAVTGNNEIIQPEDEEEGVIEGVVNGENEIESLNEEGQGVAEDSSSDDVDVAALIEAGNMEQLAALVLNGEGNRLIGQTSDNPELQAFLDNVPVYMSKINKIHLASRDGSLKDLQAALDRRKFAIAKESISPNGATPLHIATIFGNTSIVRYLAGRFPETLLTVDDNSRTPLHYAALINDNGHYYNLLMHLGANNKHEDKFGHTPEYYRMNQDEFNHKGLLEEFGVSEEMIQEMIDDKDSPSNNNSQANLPFFCTEEGRYLASSLGDPLIKGLTEVANKRPPDPIAYLATYLYNFANNNNNGTSRGNLRSRGRTQENQALVKGVPTNIDSDKAVPTTIDVVTLEPDDNNQEEDSAFSSTTRDEHGQSMLHFAAARAHGRNALYQLLVETDINIGYRDELYRTARDISIQANIADNTLEIDRYVIQIATKGDTDKLVELLLDGYDHIIDLIDEENVPILEAVNKADQPETAAFLQSILTFEERRERVHHAIRQGDLNEVKTLLADENDTGSGKLLAIGKNSYGRCTLHIAVLCEQEEIVDYLGNNFPETLKVGDNLERTALHYAMGVEKIESISRVLIKAGGKRVAKDLKGRQPTYYFMNKSDILRLQEEEETF